MASYPEKIPQRFGPHGSDYMDAIVEDHYKQIAGEKREKRRGKNKNHGHQTTQIWPKANPGELFNINEGEIIVPAEDLAEGIVPINAQLIPQESEINIPEAELIKIPEEVLV